MYGTPRRRSSLTAFVKSTVKTVKKAARGTQQYGGGVGGDVGVVGGSSGSDPLPSASQQKENVSAMLSASAEIPEPYRATEVLFIAKVHKPDRVYSDEPVTSSTYSSITSLFHQGKDRYVAVYRPTASPLLAPTPSKSSSTPSPGGATFVYIVVLEDSSVEIRYSAPLLDLMRIVCSSREQSGNLELNFSNKDPCEFSATPQIFAGDNNNGFDSRENIIWNLIQLCRVLAPASASTPFLEGLDKEELEFASSVHGFLADNPTLCALVESADNNLNAQNSSESFKTPNKGSGSQNSKNLFSNRQEELDAEKVLNELPWATTTVDGLKVLLQERLTSLENDTCTNLIQWEEDQANPDTILTPLSTFTTTLKSLDAELEEMENWLVDKIETLQPLTDDCKNIENENLALEHTWKSYASLASEMDRLLNGLSISPESESMLNDPVAFLLPNASEDGHVNPQHISKESVETIASSGTRLRHALDKAAMGGGVHLLAVNERVETLLKISGRFCKSLSDFLIKLFDTVGSDMSVGLYSTNPNFLAESHSTPEPFMEHIGKQHKKFHSLLSDFVPLIKTLSMLKPEILPNLRKSYSAAVCEGVFNKKMVKAYFRALEGDDTGHHGSRGQAPSELKDYTSWNLRVRGDAVECSESSASVRLGMQNLEGALEFVVPLIEEEGDFVQELFGFGNEKSEQEKTRNFEALRKCVSGSTQFIEMYMSRLVGLQTAQGIDLHPERDVIFNLVTTVLFSEKMGRIEGETGGKRAVKDFVATFKESTEKQWHEWVSGQVLWVKTHPGVPSSGKRAGVFTSFAKFPCFVDQVFACNGGEGGDGVGSLILLADALFESLEECRERDSTDKQYAADVMTIENCNFFVKSMAQRIEAGKVFEKHIQKADTLLAKSSGVYIKWMIKREFKGLYGLFLTISRIRKDVGDRDVPIHCPRSTFVRTLSKEAGVEVVKDKIVEIRKRMEKHLSEESCITSKLWADLTAVFVRDYAGFENVSMGLYSNRPEVGVDELGRLLREVGGERLQRRRSGRDGSGSGTMG